MNKRQSQSGSAHLIIIIVLVVALLGALGYVFYLNFMQQKATPAPASVAVVAPSEVALSETESDQFLNTGLSIKRPSSWSASTTGGKDTEMGSNVITITSPDGNTDISFRITSGGGLGGTCTEGNGVISKFDKDTIPGYPNAIFVSQVIANNNGTQDYYLGIESNSGSIQSVVTGSDACEVYLADIHGLPELKAGNMQLFATFKNVNNHTTSTLSSFEKLSETDNYKIVKRIIQSL
ncbi:MAG: hypothetical protein WCJ36_03675, partial [Candidatus Saccharibacteria bacterium]